jgi:two-component system, LytTR family, sensor kinase
VTDPRARENAGRECRIDNGGFPGCAMIPTPDISPVRKWGLIFACWTFSGIFFAAQTSLYGMYRGRPLQPEIALAIYLTCAWSWFLLTPLILPLAKRFPLSGRPVIRNVAIHFGASIFFSIVALMMVELSQRLLNMAPPGMPLLTSYADLVASQIHADILRYWAVIGIVHGISYYRGLRAREVVESTLRAELAEANVEALRRQLHPHFLFNTLNSISVLMFEDPKIANHMLTRLSDLLRATLTTDTPHEVTLERELEFIGRYLEIESMRFGDRLTINIDVDVETRAARVPNLLLQPLVENAIKHGIAAVDGPSTITIRAVKRGDELQLEVRDDGRGLIGNPMPGIGLSNTEARLRHLYGERQRLSLLSPEEGGTSVNVALPFRGGMSGCES